MKVLILCYCIILNDVKEGKNAEGGSRTPTGLLPQIPETCASTSSTTSAFDMSLWDKRYYTVFMPVVSTLAVDFERFLEIKYKPSIAQPKAFNKTEDHKRL